MHYNISYHRPIQGQGFLLLKCQQSSQIFRLFLCLSSALADEEPAKCADSEQQTESYCVLMPQKDQTVRVQLYLVYTCV